MASLFATQALRPSPKTSQWICQSCRHKSTFRRTRKALRVKPDPSFLPSKTETQDHIIFNPPSSAPNVYHTPLKFLPKGDPRRKYHSAATSSPPPLPETPEAESAPQTTLQSIAAARNNLATTRLPPPVRPVQEKKYHLTEVEVEEMRRLRAEDPRQWTRERLAEKFDCSQFFVSLCCNSPEMKARQEKVVEMARARWGRRKREAREDRVTRRKLWGLEA